MKKTSIYNDLNRIHDKIGYWWRDQLKHDKAIALCDRFEELLKTVGDDNGSIVLQEQWALLYTVRGNLKSAIKHQEKAAEYLGRAKALGPPFESSWLIDCLTELARLYKDVGDTHKSEDALQRAAAERKG